MDCLSVLSAAETRDPLLADSWAEEADGNAPSSKASGRV